MALFGNERFGVSDEVLDSPRAMHIDEAENRLHVQKALLDALLAGGTL